MNTMELDNLLLAARMLHARAADAIRVLEAQHKAEGVPALEPGAVVTFRHRGKELKGQLGQVRGEELYVYVDNDDGFGATGYRTTKARLVYPDVALSGEGVAAAHMLGTLVAFDAKRSASAEVEL